MPRSSYVFLLIVFAAVAFMIQLVMLNLGWITEYWAMNRFYMPMVNWLSGGRPADGEGAVIMIAFLVAAYSVVASAFVMALFLIVQRFRSR